MHWASILTGAGILLTGWCTGRISRTPKPTTPPAPDLRCGCAHELAMHDPQSNRCHATEREAKYNARGSHIGYENVQCSCRQYTGPRPIDQVFQPRLQLPE